MNKYRCDPILFDSRYRGTGTLVKTVADLCRYGAGVLKQPKGQLERRLRR